jgi:hypothetical protein
MFSKILSHSVVGLVAALGGAVAMALAIDSARPLSESPALHLSDNFGILDDPGSTSQYVAFFVGREDRVSGQVVVPTEEPKERFAHIYYTDNIGHRLLSADLSSDGKWHRFRVLDWDHKVIANFDAEDDGLVYITDGAGAMLAYGTRLSESGAFKFSSPGGLELATISSSPDGHWEVNISNCSKISRATYALFAGYQTVISTHRATSI